MYTWNVLNKHYPQLSTGKPGNGVYNPRYIISMVTGIFNVLQYIYTLLYGYIGIIVL